MQFAEKQKVAFYIRGVFILFEKKDFVDIRDLLIQTESFFAHRKDENNNKETLKEHTEKCQFYFLEIIDKKNLSGVFERFVEKYFHEITKEGKYFFYQLIMNTITFHDLGKINPIFQNSKMKNKLKASLSEFEEEQSHHSHLSSVMYIDYYLFQLKNIISEDDRKALRPFVYLHAYAISKHHSALGKFQDFMKNFEGTSSKTCTAFEKLKESKLYIFESDLLWENLSRQANVICKKLRGNSEMESIWLYGYMRFLFSLLVTCDYYATTSYMNNLEISSFGNIEDIDEFYEGYQNTDLVKNIRNYEREHYKKREVSLDEKNIFVMRNEMFLDAESVLNEQSQKSFFFLEAPTGSGKSNVAVNCSLKLIHENCSLRKIFYVYPFNTLVEQNLSSLEKIYGKNSTVFQKIAVVNALTPMKNITEDNYKQYTESYEKILLDRQFLNYPFVLTTHVSLFDTLFGNSRESVFGFHQIANSVIVLDEIQSYKNTIWTEIVMFLKEFSELFQIKVIIMSATLPNFEQLVAYENLCVRLITNREKYFEHPIFKKRVQVRFDLMNQKMDMDILLKHVIESAKGKGKVLVEFIRKKSANEFYQKLKEEGLSILVELMSGDDNSIERHRILQQVSMPQENGFILVATQVVEAGIDIDMDIGYKNYSKLDSEEQFLGRINRSGLKSGDVYFFEMDSPEEIYINDFRMNKEFTIKEVEMQDILANKNFNVFYEKVLRLLQENLNESTGEKGLASFFQTAVKSMDFSKVATHMKLIDNNQCSVPVFFSGEIYDEKTGRSINGNVIWQHYADLLKDQSLPYAQKRVELSNVKSDMNYFMYQLSSIKYLNIFDDQIGEIYYVEDRSPYFKEGKLNLTESVHFI